MLSLVRGQAIRGFSARNAPARASTSASTRSGASKLAGKLSTGRLETTCADRMTSPSGIPTFVGWTRSASWPAGLLVAGGTLPANDAEVQSEPTQRGSDRAPLASSKESAPHERESAPGSLGPAASAVRDDFIGQQCRVFERNLSSRTPDDVGMRHAARRTGLGRGDP